MDLLRNHTPVQAQNGIWIYVRIGMSFWSWEADYTLAYIVEPQSPPFPSFRGHWQFSTLAMRYHRR